MKDECDVFKYIPANNKAYKLPKLVNFMYILGINIDHNSTACLLKDGKIVGCVSEERFSRIKNHWGVPLTSVNYLLKSNDIKMKDVDYLVIDDLCPVTTEHPDRRKPALESITKKPFHQRVLSKIAYNFPNFFDSYYNTAIGYKRFKLKRQTEGLRKDISRIFKLPENKVKVIGHHLAHALAACGNLPKNKKTLIFSLDGQSNEWCAAVNVFDGKNMKGISKSKKKASVGFLYTLITIFLGMKPNQHEFKVMGLAAYAKEDNIDEVYQKFKELIWINDDLEFDSKFDLFFFENFFKKELKFVRFDVIAGAMQRLVEDLTEEWVKKTIQKTGIRDIALTGGVFMNVKANQKISELPEVKSLFVMPSCGDESNPIGCCFYGYKKFCEENAIEFNPRPLEDIYLGPIYDNKYIEDLIKKEQLDKKYKITKVKNINKKVAELLAKGEIVARCSGRTEWGARALGNRSILANAADPDTIRILNETIKDRDFWMPFTPSMLDKAEKEYIINPKKIASPYMAITFDSTELARKELKAAMHPYDFTIRPQRVTKNHNPDYYELIDHYQKLTGTGAILNTSFNLHGEPNVLTPEDALHTLEGSDLKFLAMEDYLLEKKH